MNKIITIMLAVIGMFIAGCNDQLPTVEKMTTVSTLIGRTAALAVEVSKTKTEVKEAITTVLDAAATVVPATNQTFSAAWHDIIETEVKKLVDNKKIDESQAAVVKTAMFAATQGIDLVFTRYPNAKEVKELVSVAVQGFVTGFKSVVNTTGMAAPGEIDQEAFDIIAKKLVARK